MAQRQCQVWGGKKGGRVGGEGEANCAPGVSEARDSD